ncbi:MAG: FAD-dependent oxidoreductase [Spirochaetia bacterium]
MEVDVVVIGGGATGSGVAWDLALRGLRVMLVEKGDLSSGTSGRYHGLLHSGARYATSDTETARDCMTENVIVRRILAGSVDDTGGMFVLLPGDDPSFVERWIAGCRAAGISIRELTRAQAREKEPSLNPELLCAFEVPDAVCHSMTLCASLTRAARSKGAKILPFHRIEGILRHNGRVEGVRISDLQKGAAWEVRTRFLVNAAGPWAGEVAALADIPLSLDLTRGALVAYKGRLVNSAVQRLRPPDDADAMVPRGQVSIAGTTEVVTEDPGDRRVETWEPSLIRERLSELLPVLGGARAVHSWSAVRPLYDPKARADGTDTRLRSRGFTILDHARTDSVEGIVSVVGGKLAIFRLMAEKTADLVCERLGIDVPCRTADTPID